ncbi:MAG: hypothetical protein HETSPECPRED_008524 [Heterodermia speciosa]|uniref:Uncharacterized protein n=1 Tax=Heterodermia speciosa TaxID=116794 RepID=A0A8H3G1Y8_9LECA|nr:MAG: hypothetical protein HETSPECPRED_008524 [Heterodermia speciosa]
MTLTISGKNMAEIVSVGSKPNIEPLSCLNAKLAFFKKQIQIWEKLQEIEKDGGFKRPALPGEKVSDSIEFTILDIEDQALELKEGDLTDSEIFELLEKLVEARDDAKSKIHLWDYFLAMIDGAIVAVLNCHISTID